MTEKPVILREGEYSKEGVRVLRNKSEKLVDIYTNQLRELFEVENPKLIYSKDFEKKFSVFKKEKLKAGTEIIGDWVLFPWSNTLLHTLNEKQNDFLRTNRNRNIITLKEQEILSNITIAFAGLSVGGNMATAMLYNGFPKNFKLADFDVLETTNLNRVRGKLTDIGESKLDIISRQLYELDPYIKIKSFPLGLSKKNLDNFVSGTPKPRIIFEIIDDFEVKILLRQLARKHKIPVVMLTSLGDGVLVDVERYDTEHRVKIFNGEVDEEILNKILSGEIKDKEKHKYAMDIVGIDNLPNEIKGSIREIGKTLVGRPQLMSTVTVASGLAVFFARKIVLGDLVKSGRTMIKFNS